MKALIPFSFENREIRVVTIDGEPWFVAKDIVEALEYSDATLSNIGDAVKHVPEEWKGRFPIPTPGGTQEMLTLSESGFYFFCGRSDKSKALPFQKWAAGEVFPAIRKTGSYTAQGGGFSAPPSVIQPTKEFRALFGVARLVGMDKNAAAISANQAVTKITGTNVLQLLGHVHLAAENQKVLFFTPTELGERLGISGRKFNMLLAEAGLQAKKGEHWVPLIAAEGFCRIMDTGKRHGDGTMVQQIKWADNVLAIIQPQAA